MTIEDKILAAKQAAAEAMYEALREVSIRLSHARKLNMQDAYLTLCNLSETVNESLNSATYAVLPICPNCLEELPTGCRGKFKESNGTECLWEETKKEPL